MHSLTVVNYSQIPCVHRFGLSVLLDFHFAFDAFQLLACYSAFLWDFGAVWFLRDVSVFFQFQCGAVAHDGVAFVDGMGADETKKVFGFFVHEGAQFLDVAVFDDVVDLQRDIEVGTVADGFAIGFVGFCARGGQGFGMETFVFGRDLFGEPIGVARVFPGAELFVSDVFAVALFQAGQNLGVGEAVAKGGVDPFASARGKALDSAPAAAI